MVICPVVARRRGDSVLPDRHEAAVICVAARSSRPPAPRRRPQPGNQPAPSPPAVKAVRGGAAPDRQVRAPATASVTTAANGRYSRCSNARSGNGNTLEVGPKIKKNHAPSTPQTLRFTMPHKVAAPSDPMTSKPGRTSPACWPPASRSSGRADAATGTAADSRGSRPAASGRRTMHRASASRADGAAVRSMPPGRPAVPRSPPGRRTGPNAAAAPRQNEPCQQRAVVEQHEERRGHHDFLGGHAQQAGQHGRNVPEGKRGQAPFVRSTRRAVPAKGACPLFPHPWALPAAPVVPSPRVATRGSCRAQSAEAPRITQ